MANNFEKMKDIAKEVNKLLQNTTEYEESTGNVIIKDDVIANLNKCVGLLKNILKIYKALPDFFDIPIPSVSKNDGLEIITKFAFVIEAANRIAKLPISKQNNEISRTFYSIKSSGIRKISRLSNISEITHKGSAIDLSKSIPTYSLQIGDKNQDKKKYAVVSWHLSTNLAGPDAYLINPSCKGWKAYSGEPITAYNPPDSGLRQFGMEDRYNEEGFRALMSMLADRRKSKIQQQISDWDKKLETQIRMNYSEDIDKKLATIRGYCQGKDIEEKRENVYLLNKILISLNFGNGMDFDKFMEEVGNKVDALYELEDMYEDGTSKIRVTGYEVLENLQSMGVSDFKNGIEILGRIKDEILTGKESIQDAKSFVEKMSKSFKGWEVFEHALGSENIIDMVVMLISEGVKSKEIDVKDFEDQEKITAFFTQIKDRVKTRIGEMENENIRDTISISELLELVDERQVDDKEILEVANQLLAFTYERDKTKIQDVPNGEFLEKATEGLSSRSILDLRKKMKEEGFIGGGRY